MTSRRWCFTLNNPLPLEVPSLWSQQASIKMMAYQLEAGDDGTPHYQGYAEFQNAVRLAAVKKLSSRAHWEVAKGSRAQNLQYVTKESTRLENPWWYDGVSWIDFSIDVPQSLRKWRNITTNSQSNESGNSTTKLRLLKIQDALRDGNCDSVEQVADSDFDLWVRYYRAFERYVCMKTKPRNHPVEVHIVQGPTGTGKSRWAMDTFPNAYWKQRSNWWDGYAGHETIIIDEFYGWLPFDLLLRVCDRYPLLLETKGGQVQMVANTIVITSNSLPANWYKSGTYFPSFVRRVSKWHIMPFIGMHSIYDNYVEFVAHASSNLITN